MAVTLFHQHLSVRLILAIQLLVTTFTVISGFPDGAPEECCDSMMPHHDENQPQPSETVPYQIVVDRTSIRPGESVTVSIQPNGDETFKGFLMKAISTNDFPIQVVGSFVPLDSYSQTLDCSLPAGGITHTEESRKSQVEFIWISPTDFVGSVTFCATIVADYSKFWGNITSEQEVNVSGDAVSVSTIYDDCNISKGCFGLPKGCVEYKNCTGVVTYVMNDDVVDFEMLGFTDGYVAMGLSTDHDMGDDSVTECVHASTGANNVYMSYNVGQETTIRLNETYLGLSDIGVDYNDGYIHCHFSRALNTNVNGLDYDLENNNYYILLALGDIKDVDTLTQHTYKSHTSSPTNFSSYETSISTTPSTNTAQSPMIYDDCSLSKGCFGLPKGCVDDKSCTGVVTYVRKDDVVDFEMLGFIDGYVAMGLSIDDDMGDDSVTECVHASTDANNVYMSYNVGQETTIRLTETHLGLSNIGVDYSDGYIHCHFSRALNTTVNGLNYDLENNNYYILLALGDIKDVDTLTQHTYKSHTSSPANFSSYETNTTPSSTIYDGCYQTKSCFGYPDGCVGTKDCTAVVTYVMRGDVVKFEMLGSTGGYVAIGLSTDTYMGDDSVTECVHASTGANNVYMAYNVGHEPTTRLQETHLGLSDIDVGYTDGYVNCRFSRALNTIVNGLNYDLKNSNFYLLLALGAIKDVDTLKRHSLVDSSNSAVNFSIISNIESKGGDVKITIHGSFMITAWVCFVSVAVFLARYYKGMWPKTMLFGNKVWFTLHRCLNLLAVVLAIVAFILIFVSVKGWSKRAETGHPITGTITVALMLIQPIMATFRPHPGTPNRPIFNWAHHAVGMTSQIMAVETMFLAYNLEKSKLPERFYWILTGFLIFDVCMFCIMEIFTLVSQKAQANADGSKGEDMENAKPKYAHEQVSMFKNGMLMVFVVGVSGFTAALIQCCCLQMTL